MEKEILEQKGKMLEEVMNDRSYVPMKAKELAMLLGIPKSQRDELAQVLDYLVSESESQRKENMENRRFFPLTAYFQAIPRVLDL